MPRRLPSPAEAAEILARKRTRPAHRPPPAACKALIPYLKTLDSHFQGVGSAPPALVRRWREIVGEVLSRRTEPVRLIRSRKGDSSTLEVRVDGPVAALIQHQGEDILARVNLALGPETVGRLRIIQGPVRAPRPAKSTENRRTRTPLDAAAEADLAASVAKAPDGPLKSALLRLGREVARRG